MGVQKGIALHRAIDSFTDSHPNTTVAKQYFRTAYGLYSGPFIDIVYDHFLATDRVAFPDDDSLAEFAKKTYGHLLAQELRFPERFGRLFPYMRSHNWLYNYQFRQGIYRSFEGLVRRAKFMHEYQPACSIFDEHYNQFQDAFNGFFPDLREFTLRKWEALNASGSRDL